MTTIQCIKYFQLFVVLVFLLKNGGFKPFQVQTTNVIFPRENIHIASSAIIPITNTTSLSLPASTITFETTTRKEKSLMCYKKDSNSESGVKLEQCSETTEYYEKYLSKAMKIANGSDLDLVSNYLKKVKECKERSNSCFYEEMTGQFGCSCPIFSITIGWQLEIKNDACDNFEELDFARHNFPLHPMKIEKDFKRISSYLPKDSFSNSLTVINNWVEMDRTLGIDPFRRFKICSCIQDKCNTQTWTSSSLQCHELSNGSGKIVPIQRLRSCSTLINNSIQELQYVQNVAKDDDSKLASKYLKLVMECPEKFDSCFFDELSEISGCSCPLFYILFGKPLRLDKTGCTVLNRKELLKNELHVENTIADLKKLSAYLPNQKFSLQMAYEKVNISATLNRNSSTILFKLCTCNSNECNTDGLPNSKNSLICYTKTKKDIDPKLTDCSLRTNEWIKLLTYLIRVANIEVSTIA